MSSDFFLVTTNKDGTVTDLTTGRSCANLSNTSSVLAYGEIGISFTRLIIANTPMGYAYSSEDNNIDTDSDDNNIDTDSDDL